MPEANRFFIIRADGSTTSVNSQQLTRMKEHGFINSDDKIIPITKSQGKKKTSTIRMAEELTRTYIGNQSTNGKKISEEIKTLDDMETAPLTVADKTIVQNQNNLLTTIVDSDINEAFTGARSQELYELTTKETAQNILQITNHKKISQAATNTYIKQFSYKIIRWKNDWTI